MIDIEENVEICSLKNDGAFKFAFENHGDIDRISSFVTYVLRRKVETIDITEDFTHPREDYIGEKSGTLDIAVALNNDEYIDIEMQNFDTGNVLKKALFYGSKMITSQLKRGDKYDKLKSIEIVFILDYNDLSFENYREEFELVRIGDNDLKRFGIRFRITLISLAKFRKNPYVAPPKERYWLMFLDKVHTIKGEELRELLKRNEVFPGIYEDLKLTEENVELRRAAELREKGLKDTASIKDAAEKRGEKTGIKKGKEKGIEEEKNSTVIRLLKAGVSITIIGKATELPEEEIRKIKQTVKL